MLFKMIIIPIVTFLRRHCGSTSHTHPPPSVGCREPKALSTCKRHSALTAACMCRAKQQMQIISSLVNNQLSKLVTPSTTTRIRFLHNIFLLSQFYVQLLDYSILLKPRHEELTHEFVVNIYKGMRTSFQQIFFMKISTSVWVLRTPNAGQNIQHFADPIVDQF